MKVYLKKFVLMIICIALILSNEPVVLAAEILVNDQIEAAESEIDEISLADENTFEEDSIDSIIEENAIVQDEALEDVENALPEEVLAEEGETTIELEDEETKAEVLDSSDEIVEEVANPEPAMPAQDFTGKTEDVFVSVHAEEGTFPRGTTMVVTPVENTDKVINAVNKAVEGKVNTLKAVDITFYNEAGKEIEPELPVSVSMKATGINYSLAQQVVHIDNKNRVEVIEDTQLVSFNSTVIAGFEADAFSIYAVVGTDGEEVLYRTYKFFDLDVDAESETYTEYIPYEFLTKSGNKTSEQKLKNGDELEDVGTPHHENYEFNGWFIYGYYDEATDTYTYLNESEIIKIDFDSEEPVIVSDIEAKDGDIISIDLSKGILVNETTGESKTFEPFKEFMLNILEEGGLVNHYLNDD